MTAREFTDDQIVDAVTQAIADRRFDLVEGLVALLALQNPTRAQEVLTTIRAGLALRVVWQAAGGS